MRWGLERKKKKRQKNDFLLLLLLFPWRNKWVFFLSPKTLFFFFLKGRRRRRSTDIPFRNNRENGRRKRTTPLTQEIEGAYILYFKKKNFFSKKYRTHSIRKKEKSNTSFFPIFQYLERNNKNFEIVLCSFKEKVTCLDEIRKCPTGESERCFCFFQ